MNIKEKAYIEQRDIVDRLREITKLAEDGYISFIDESNEGNAMELYIIFKERSEN